MNSQSEKMQWIKIIWAIVGVVMVIVWLLILWVEVIRAQWWTLLLTYIIFIWIFWYAYKVYKSQILIAVITFFGILSSFLLLDLVFFQDTYSWDYCVKSLKSYPSKAQLHYYRLYIKDDNWNKKSFKISNSAALRLAPGLMTRTWQQRCYDNIHITYWRTSNFIFEIKK